MPISPSRILSASSPRRWRTRESSAVSSSGSTKSDPRLAEAPSFLVRCAWTTDDFTLAQSIVHDGKCPGILINIHAIDLPAEAQLAAFGCEKREFRQRLARAETHRG